MLIPYAGKDDTYEVPFSTSFRRRGAAPGTRQRRAYLTFCAGHDTMRIAQTYHIKESTALRWISVERSKRLCRENPYEGKQA